MQLLRQAHLISTQRNIKFVAISLRYCITSSALNTMKRTLSQNSFISFLFFYFPLRKLLFFLFNTKEIFHISISMQSKEKSLDMLYGIVLNKRKYKQGFDDAWLVALSCVAANHSKWDTLRYLIIVAERKFFAHRVYMLQENQKQLLGMTG